MGGIGSWLIDELCQCIDQNQIDAFDHKITIADGDIVEIGQLDYQNFGLDDVGLNKAEVLTQRFSNYGIKSISAKVTDMKEFDSFDFIVLCVDNEKTRELVINYSFAVDKDFIDLRATGRKILAMSKLGKKGENMRFVDPGDSLEYSCQEKEDLQNGLIQKGNKIIALIGVQMVLNKIRGHSNKPILMTV